MFWVSISLMTASLIAALIFGLRLGVDFKGGSVMELEFTNGRPPIENIQRVFTSGFFIKDISVSPVEEKSVLIRAGELSEEQHQAVLDQVRKSFPSAGVVEKRFDSVGPVIGDELKRRSLVAIVIVLFAVIVYIALVFRKLSRTLSPWAMGLSAIVALVHDVTIPVGIFSFLGRFQGVEIGAVFVAAALTILGYSVSDTVVIFDRVRENIVRYGIKESFGATVHKSVMQTLTRSLNTTFTTLLSLVAIYFFGGETIRYFALALIIGIFLGAYSSIFVASPLLVWWNRKH